MSRRPMTRTKRAPRRSVATWALVVLVIAVAGVGVAAIAFGLSASSSGTPVSEGPAAAPRPEVDAGSSTAQSATVMAAATVEVPLVTGMRLADARVVLEAAGLQSSVPDGDSGDAASTAKIASQDPAAGTLVNGGTQVVLGFRAQSRLQGAPKESAADTPRWTVCIDPGHQSRGDSSPEPIGPGADETKPRVTGGTTGVVTKIPEYELVLQISMNLKSRLESRGVRVVMTRTTNDVNLSNSERAKKANASDADLFVRIHCDGSTDDQMAGVSTLYPGKNRWTSSVAGESRTAASRIQSAMVAATGAVNRGTKARQDLTGFNWAKVPCVLVECGFLSNPVEDRLLASPHYQDKLAEAIAEGILLHLEDSR